MRARFVWIALVLGACGTSHAPEDAGRDSGADAGVDAGCPSFTPVQCFDAWPGCCVEGPTVAPVCEDGEWTCPGFSSNHCDCEPPDAG